MNRSIKYTISVCLYRGSLIFYAKETRIPICIFPWLCVYLTTLFLLGMTCKLTYNSNLPDSREAFAENLASNLAWFVACFAGLRRGGPDSESGGEARGEHADERLREPHVQVLRGVGVRGEEWVAAREWRRMQGWWEKERKEEACCAIRRRWRKINLPPWMIYPWRRDRDLFKNLAIFEQARAIEIWDRVGSQIPMRSENCAGNFPVLEKPAAALTRSPFVLRRHPTVSHMSFHSKSTLRARNREGWRCVVSGLYKILISRHLELVYFVRPPI